MNTLFVQFGVQLRTDYDQTVRLMPWLQLESNTAEDMDGKQTPTVSSTDSSDETEEEQVLLFYCMSAYAF